MNTGQATIDLLVTTTATQLAHIAADRNLEYDSDKIATKMIETKAVWFEKILEAAKADANNADLLQGIATGRIDPLVNHSFQIALKHGCFKYAMFLLGIE